MPVKICEVESCRKEFSTDNRHSGEFFRYCTSCRPVMKALRNKNTARKTRRNAPKVKIEQEDQDIPQVLHQVRPPIPLTIMTAARYGAEWLFIGER